MTPFGTKMRDLRAKKGVTQKEMATALGISPAYLSALEHGRRGAPSWPLVQKIVGYFNIIWDEAEELQRVAESSHPRIIVDTTGLSASATLLANRLASQIAGLDEDDIRGLLGQLSEMQERGKRR